MRRFATRRLKIGGRSAMHAARCARPVETSGKTSLSDSDSDLRAQVREALRDALRDAAIENRGPISDARREVRQTRRDERQESLSDSDSDLRAQVREALRDALRDAAIDARVEKDNTQQKREVAKPIIGNQ